MRLSNLFNLLNRRIKEERIKHVQLLFRVKNGRPVAKFVSVDTEEYRQRVKFICKSFPKSLEFFEETPTTISYFV